MFRLRSRLLNFKKTLILKQYSQKAELNIIKPFVPDIQIPKISLGEFVFRDYEKWSDKIALECLGTGRKYKYFEVYQNSINFAYFLKNSLKLEGNSTIAVILPNVPEYPIVVLGILQAGLKVTTINPNYKPDEIQKQLQLSKASAIIALTDAEPTIKKAIKSMQSDMPVILIPFKQHCTSNGKSINFLEIIEKKCDLRIGSQTDIWEDLAILPYSSGTTGIPKGVQLSHKNIVSNLCQMSAKEFNLIQSTSNEFQEVVPAILPFFHIYGLVVVLMNALRQGCKILTVPEFSSEVFVKTLKNHNPTVLFLVPPIIHMIINNPNIKAQDVETVRAVISGAAPFGAQDVESFVTKTKGRTDFLQLYGLTETSPLTLIQTKSIKDGVKIGGAGFLLPNTEAKVVALDDPTYTALPPNKTGELLFRGPQIMKGYFNNKQATDDMIIEGDWLKTGDIGHYDSTNHFFITDRLKELIKVKGFQVAPAELEELLRTHPLVEDVAVIGTKHEKFGEVPKAFIVRKSQSLKEKDLQDFVAEKVSDYKHLIGGVEFMESIPKNPSGKILRKLLRN